jgi:hypothetical protein
MRRTAEVRRVVEKGYWRESDARVLVEAWRSSGETLAAFARQHGVERHRLARWVGRLESASAEALRFHPVRLVDRRSEPETGGSTAIEIQLAGGPRIRVPRGFEADELRRVLAVLGETAGC